MDKLSKTLFMLGDSLYAVFARIAEILDEHIRVRTHNEVTVSKLITEKNYDSYDISQMLMPGLAKYL